jgi:hypothetical protein
LQLTADVSRYEEVSPFSIDLKLRQDFILQEPTMLISSFPASFPKGVMLLMSLLLGEIQLLCVIIGNMNPATEGPLLRMLPMAALWLFKWGLQLP